VWTGYRNGDAAQEVEGGSGADDEDLSRRCDVDVEAAGDRIMHRPSRAARKLRRGEHGTVVEVDHRQRWLRRITKACGQSEPGVACQRKAVWPRPHLDAPDGGQVVRGCQADGALASAGADEQASFFAHRRPCHAWEPLQRRRVDTPVEIDHLHGVVGRMGDVEPVGAAVHGCMVEAALCPMGRQHDAFEGAQGHDQLTLRNSPSECPLVRHCRQYA